MTPGDVASLRRRFGAIGLAVLVAGCSTTPARHGVDAARSTTSSSPSPSPAGSSSTRGGGYYLDDGPGDNPPPNLDLVPDAVPKIEKYASGANRPYNVFGVDYVPDLSGAPYKQRGVGSWYGRKFHGQRTSSGEIYDMYAMTAAHPTLPIPCYALVTNVQNGKSVIVRVNDRGPFLHNRVMDLSYAAAVKLGYLSSGSELIEVQMIQPADIAAGRIPITTNALYVAAAAARGERLAAPTTAGATVQAPASPTTAAVAVPAPVPDFGTPSIAIAALAPTPTTAPSRPPAAVDSTPLPASYAERGIPPDLIPDAEPPAKLPETSTSAGFYLQLGAFRVRAGADSFAAHVTREIDPGIASKVQVADANGLYRVRIGPYAQRGDADRAAVALRSTIAQPVVVMPEGLAR